jgi:hypothetical protein
MKALGAEILAFWREWPPGDVGYYDDGIDIVDDADNDALIPEEKYDLDDFGNIVWQGKDEPPLDKPWDGHDAVSFGLWFKRWKKARTHATFVVEVKVEDVDAFRAYCAANNVTLKK